MQVFSMSTLDEAINSVENLIKKAKPGTSTTMKSAVAALYTADRSGEMRYSNCIGLLQLDSDRQLKTYMLRFYDIEAVTLVFEVELYYGFGNHYKMIKDTFYVFEYPMGLVGALFKSKEDADMMKAKIISISPKIQEFEEIKKRRIIEAKEKKKEGSLFNKVKGLFSDEPDEPKVMRSGEVISVHKAIAFDLKTGQFSKNNIPPEWQEIFDSLKLTQDDLNDKEITNLIVEETILHQVKAQAEKSQDKTLQLKIKEAEEEEKEYEEALKQTVLQNLPPPPILPPLLLNPPSMTESISSKRANLMEEIRNNKLQLNHIEKINNGVNLDISNMNKEERMDHAERLRQKLRMRKRALNRREASSEEEED